MYVVFDRLLFFGQDTCLLSSADPLGVSGVTLVPPLPLSGPPWAHQKRNILPGPEQVPVLVLQRNPLPTPWSLWGHFGPLLPLSGPPWAHQRGSQYWSHRGTPSHPKRHHHHQNQQQKQEANLPLPLALPPPPFRRRRRPTAAALSPRRPSTLPVSVARQ